jgi:hypothetical protein
MFLLILSCWFYFCPFPPCFCLSIFFITFPSLFCLVYYCPICFFFFFISICFCSYSSILTGFISSLTIYLRLKVLVFVFYCVFLMLLRDSNGHCFSTILGLYSSKTEKSINHQRKLHQVPTPICLG